MRRARIAATLVTFVLALCAPGVSRAAKTVTRISAFGILDYTAPPTFKVGDYVRYVVTTIDEPGPIVGTPYYLTVLIAGQEVFWGERCFWLETWTEGRDRQTSAALALMSYDSFKDSRALDHITDYERKYSFGLKEDSDQLEEVLMMPQRSSLTSRASASEAPRIHADTTGVDTTQTPAGTFRTLVTAEYRAWDKSGSSGDSTIYKQRSEINRSWKTDDVPLTRSARNETISQESRRTWFIGHSKEGTPDQITMRSTVNARLVEFGHGLKPRLLPPGRARSFDDPPAGRKAAPGAKPGTAAGGAGRR